MEREGGGRLYTFRYTVTTRMTPALPLCKCGRNTLSKPRLCGAFGAIRRNHTEEIRPLYRASGDQPPGLKGDYSIVRLADVAVNSGTSSKHTDVKLLHVLSASFSGEFW